MLVPGSLINGADDESFPVVTPDELTLYFSSNRANGAGLQDIYVARRASVSDNFGAPVNLAELNTGTNDFPTWISDDGCVLYLMSGTMYDIYYATRGM